MLSYAAISAQLVHRHLAHCGKHKLKDSEQEDDLENFKYHCEVCQIAKSKKLISRIPQIRAKQVGNITHVDLQSVKPRGLGGANYFLILVDDKSQMVFTEPIKKKTDVTDVLKTFVKE